MKPLKVGDLVIFRKNGKEWHHGKIVEVVNNRSYIITDSFDNYFRRNRRFIARTINDDFNASELLFEENVKKGYSNHLPEIQIVNQINIHDLHSIIDNNQNEENPTNIVIADESDLPVESDGDLPSEYETAESSESDASFEHNIGVNPVPGSQDGSTTRSGRVIRPPQRYGW